MRPPHLDTPTLDAPERRQHAPYWKHSVAVKRHFCMSTDWQSVMKSMNKIGTVLLNDPHFDDFAELDFFFAEGSLARSNELLDKLYDFCDERRIWVE